MADSGRTRTVANVFVGLVFLGLLGSCWSFLSSEPKERTPEEEASNKLESALVRCQNEAKARVADSDRMEFAPFGEWLADFEGGENAIALTFAFKAKNGFGVLTPAVMTCRATYDGKHWTVIEMFQR